MWGVRRKYLACWVVEENLEVLDGEIGDANVLDFASSRKLLNLCPCLDKIPVWEMFLQIGWVGRTWPMHKVQINVVDTEGLEGRVNSLLNSLVPWVVELGGNPDLFSWYTGVFDSSSNLCFVSVCKLMFY